MNLNSHKCVPCASADKHYFVIGTRVAFWRTHARLQYYLSRACVSPIGAAALQFAASLPSSRFQPSRSPVGGAGGCLQAAQLVDIPLCRHIAAPLLFRTKVRASSFPLNNVLIHCRRLIQDWH